MTWSEDSAVKKAVLLIRQDIKDESIHIVECTWIYEPMINYYRLEYGVPVQEVFREDIQYKGEYLVIQNEWTPKPDYESILMDRTSGLAVYKRKVTSAN